MCQLSDLCNEAIVYYIQTYTGAICILNGIQQKVSKLRLTTEAQADHTAPLTSVYQDLVCFSVVKKTR